MGQAELAGDRLYGREKPLAQALPLFAGEDGDLTVAVGIEYGDALKDAVFSQSHQFGGRGSQPGHGLIQSDGFGQQEIRIAVAQAHILRDEGLGALEIQGLDHWKYCSHQTWNIIRFQSRLARVLFPAR